MLEDDDLLLDDLGEEAERALQLVERRALTDLDPNDASGPADAAANPAQVFLLASCSHFECESMQIVPKRKMPDGREVSLYWGGATNPDGSLKKEKMPEGQAKVRKKGARTKRAGTKAAIRERWVEQRKLLDGRKQWQGPRCFDAWLLAQGERALDQMQDAEVAEMPQVCHCCAVFADFSGVQKWQWYVCTMEQLAKAYAKDKKVLQASLDSLKQDFQLSTTSK